MRVLDYGRTAVRDITTQPLRCLLTTTAVALSSALLVTLVSIGISTRGAIVGHLTQGDALSTIIVSANSSVGGGLLSTSVQQTRSDSEKLTDTVASQLQALPRVKSVTPQISIWELKSFLIEGSTTSYVASALATSGKGQAPAQLAAGSWFNNEDATPSVVLGDGYIRALGIRDKQSLIGKKITFTTTAGYRGAGADIPTWNADKQARSAFENRKTTLSATIVGVTVPSAHDSQLYVPLAWSKHIQSPRTSTPTGETSVDTFDKTGYTNIIVTTDDSTSVAKTARSISDLGLGATTYQKQIDQINQLSLILWVILGAVALISIISASLGIVNTLLMSVSEQKHTIYIWRACGASRRLIAQLYVLQAVILSLVGATIGAAVGAYACSLINTRIETALSSQGLTTVQLPNAPLWVIGGSIFVSVAIAVLASLYPAYVATRK